MNPSLTCDGTEAADTRHSSYLLRLSSELIIKSPVVRARFVRCLVKNLRKAYLLRQERASAVGALGSPIPLVIIAEWSRLFVMGDEALLADLLPKTFGISSFSQLVAESSDSLQEVLEVGERVFASNLPGHSFAVKVKRTGNQPYTSQFLCEQLGARLRPYARCVQLKDPEVTVGIEVRPGRAYFFASQRQGAQGLPLGASGRALCLLSGGYDSVVAAWMMMKRGLSLDFLLCNLAGAAHERAVLAVAKQLIDDWGAEGTKRPSVIHVVDFKPLAMELKAKVKSSYAQVVLKRLFYRAAEVVAIAEKADAIITGECVGQVSSQTVQNLRSIESASSLPILRPVVGMDKYEIMNVSRKIGAFDLSRKIQEHCQMSPDRPVTAASIPILDFQEKSIDSQLLLTLTASRQSYIVQELTNAGLVSDYLFVVAVPPGAMMIDCNDSAQGSEDAKAQYFAKEGAQVPGPTSRSVKKDSLVIALHDLPERLNNLSKDRTYILHCERGQQSAIAAEMMQSAGFTAYSLRGGTPSLRREQTMNCTP